MLQLLMLLVIWMLEKLVCEWNSLWLARGLCVAY